MTNEEKIAFIESHGYVVSVAPEEKKCCVWDPLDDDEGFCIRGDIDIILAESVDHIKMLQGTDE